jgi:hypothetical protein
MATPPAHAVGAAHRPSDAFTLRTSKLTTTSRDSAMDSAHWPPLPPTPVPLTSQLAPDHAFR